MKDLIISLEATCDLPKKVIDEYGFRVVDMVYYVNGEEYSAAEGSALLYEKMAQNAKTSTSMINATIYQEFFEELLKEGKPIFHLGFSTGLSGSYAQAEGVIKELRAQGKEIYSIDTLCGCSGQGLLAMLVKEFADTAENIEQVIEYAQSLKMNISHSYTVETFKYLAVSGRIKPVQAFLANMFNIKPVMRVDDEGRLDLCKKVLSRKKAIRAMFEQFIETRDAKYNYCIIAHAACRLDADYLAGLIKEKTGVECIITDLGAIIGSHSGPGTFSMYYVSAVGREVK